MKYKLLATCVAVAVLSGCGSDKDSDTSIQAYDGAIQGIAGTFECENGQTGSIPATDSTGYATIDNATVQLYPETCTFTFNATAGAVDVSNGKDMSDLSLSIPQGLAQAGVSPKATPFTTLITKALDGAEYNESSATTVITSLGLGDLLNSDGVTVSEIMTDLDSVITKLKSSSSANYSKLVATTHILSDVLAKTQDSSSSSASLTVTQIATAAQNLATKIVTTYTNYPLNSSGEEIVVNIKSDSNYSDLSSVTEEVLDDSEIASIAQPEEQEAEAVTDDSTSSDDSTDDSDDSTGGSNDSTGATGGTSGV